MEIEEEFSIYLDIIPKDFRIFFLEISRVKERRLVVKVIIKMHKGKVKF